MVFVSDILLYCDQTHLTTDQHEAEATYDPGLWRADCPYSGPPDGRRCRVIAAAGEEDRRGSVPGLRDGAGESDVSAAGSERWELCSGLEGLGTVWTD